MIAKPLKTPLRRLNQMNAHAFARTLEGLFAGAPWVLERTFAHHPFASLNDLHDRLHQTLMQASEPDRLALIWSQPDLMARLGHAHEVEDKAVIAAGLDHLGNEDIEAFEAYNDVYRETFHFPFVICLMDCPRATIAAAFARRLKHTRPREIDIAVEELGKIADRRLDDMISQE